MVLALSNLSQTEPPARVSPKPPLEVMSQAEGEDVGLRAVVKQLLPHTAATLSMSAKPGAASIPPPKYTQEQKDQIHQAIAIDRANGMDIEAVSQKYNVPASTLRQLFEMPKFIDRVFNVQTAANMPLKQRTANAAVVAFELRYRMMFTSQDEKVLEAVSRDFLDREMGKPTQSVVTTNLNFDMSKTGDIRERRLAAQRRLEVLQSQKQMQLAKSA